MIWRRFVNAILRIVAPHQLNPLTCGVCHRRGRELLIRNACEVCAPDVHARYRECMRVLAQMDECFYRATGKKSLDDWDGFERWAGRE